jgi:hypothetical protein
MVQRRVIYEFLACFSAAPADIRAGTISLDDLRKLDQFTDLTDRRQNGNGCRFQ